MTWTSDATIPTHKELDSLSWDCEASIEGVSITFGVSVGSVLPDGLTLSSVGVLSGILGDMDSYVPEYAKPAGFVFDETNYATWGSALSGSKDFSFSIDAIGSDGSITPQLHTITINNNWSSDRDNFIKELDNDFFIDGAKVSNEEYLTVMKSRGYFPT